MNSVRVYTLETGFFKLDGGAMFGTVPKPLWQKAIEPDEQNRILMALRILVVHDAKANRLLIVDTGIGDKWSEKLLSVYAIDHSKYSLVAGLQNLGFTADQVTDVVLTHLHFDHAGGATVKDAQQKIVPQFKNAKYYIQKKNYDWATAPNYREAASYLPENFAPLLESKQLLICDGVEDFESKVQWPGLSVFISDGHTVGLQCPILKTENKTYFYPSDLIPTSAHLPLPWVMGYDIHVIQLLDEKESVLNRAVQENWTLVYEHDPVIAASTVKKGAKHFERDVVQQLNHHTIAI